MDALPQVVQNGDPDGGYPGKYNLAIILLLHFVLIVDIYEWFATCHRIALLSLFFCSSQSNMNPPHTPPPPQNLTLNHNLLVITIQVKMAPSMILICNYFSLCVVETVCFWTIILLVVDFLHCFISKRLSTLTHP